ncbi:MAG: hypothetical protein EAZ95_17985 [Bacteroidetes bacterium]|nr:MAG: hypothetical protein EAZ95_17985 [Bacteroidota bacterium]
MQCILLYPISFMATLTIEQERTLLQNFFNEAREILQDYSQQRSLIFSNSQLFSFVLVSPITIAIASDGNLDLSEICSSIQRLTSTN